MMGALPPVWSKAECPLLCPPPRPTYARVESNAGKNTSPIPAAALLWGGGTGQAVPGLKQRQVCGTLKFDGKGKMQAGVITARSAWEI